MLLLELHILHSRVGIWYFGQQVANKQTEARHNINNQGELYINTQAIVQINNIQILSSWKVGKNVATSAFGNGAISRNPTPKLEVCIRGMKVCFWCSSQDTQGLVCQMLCQVGLRVIAIPSFNITGCTSYKYLLPSQPAPKPWNSPRPSDRLDLP